MNNLDVRGLGVGLRGRVGVRGRVRGRVRLG